MSLFLVEFFFVSKKIKDGYGKQAPVYEKSYRLVSANTFAEAIIKVTNDVESACQFKNLTIS